MTDTKETTVDSLDEELLSQFEQHFLAIESDEDREQILRGLRAVYAAGVRGAREAVLVDPTWPRGMYGAPDDMYASVAIRRKFDALLREREGV